MKRIALLLLAVLVAACATTKPPVVDKQTDDETRGAIKQLTDAIAQQPTHMPWIYLLATYHDKAGQTGEVVRLLARLDELGWQHGVSPIAFPNSRGSAFRNAAAKLASREPHVRRASLEFPLTGQKDLVPEGIAYDPEGDVFYISGIYRRKVLRVTPDGRRITDFVSEAQDGMLGGLGMKIDRNRRLLWVISTTTKEMRGHVPGVDKSMLAAYDLRDGKLVRKLDVAPAMLNDLTLLDDGTLFATDMGRHKVVRLPPGADAFEDFADGPPLPQRHHQRRHQPLHRRLPRPAPHHPRRQDPHENRSPQHPPRRHRRPRLPPGHAHRHPELARQPARHPPPPRRKPRGSARDEEPALRAADHRCHPQRKVLFIANPGLRSFDEKGRIWAEERLMTPVMLRLPL